MYVHTYEVTTVKFPLGFVILLSSDLLSLSID